MAHPLATRTIAAAPATERVEFLKGVLALTSVGLVLTAISGVIAAQVMGGYFFVERQMPLTGESVLVMQHQWIYLGVMIGALFGAQGFGTKLAMGNTPELGLVVGAVLMGVVLGPLLYLAWHMGEVGGNGFTLIGQAFGLTALTAVGMTGYVWSKPRDFSLLGAALAAVALPMFALMIISWVFPMGSTMTLFLLGGFIVFCAGTLLFKLNHIIHTMGTEYKALAAVTLTLSIGLLFYHILNLLMILQGRD